MISDRGGDAAGHAGAAGLGSERGDPPASSGSSTPKSTRERPRRPSTGCARCPTRRRPSSASMSVTRSGRRRAPRAARCPGRTTRKVCAVNPTFGIFDHIEDIPGTPTQQLSPGSARLIKQADEAGFAGFHLAEHHGSGSLHGTEPRGVHRGRVAGHEEDPSRADGEAVAAAPSRADHRGHVRGRPAHERAARLRRRSGCRADRALLVRQQLAGVEGALRGHAGHHLRRARHR